MITVDISNIWGEVALPDLLAIESEVTAAHETLLEGAGAEGACRKWLELPARETNPELFRILLAAERIRNDSEACVVVGAGCCCLGARAAIELLQGPNHNLGKGRGNPQIFFTGNQLSTRYWNELTGLLKDKDFSVIVVGDSLESGLAFRSLRWMLERKYGTDEAKRRIYAVADPEKGTLGRMAAEEKWECFAVPAGMPEGYGVLTAVGLLPMAVAGMDIQEVLAGAGEAKEEYAMGSFENPVWLYAAVRNLLYRGGKAVEILASGEPGVQNFGRWWQRLAGESAGKGLFSVPADPRELGPLLQNGTRNLMETVIRFDPPENKAEIGGDWKNLDGLNYLEGKTLDFVEESASQAAVSVHVDGGVPVITMDCGVLNDRKTGELFCFVERCCAMSACLLGVDPFRESGGEIYEENLFRLLGKPESE